MPTDHSNVLFVGWGDGAGVPHYRTKLPARMLGAEWVIFLMDGEPLAGDGDRVDHDIIVVQSCWEKWQLDTLRRMRQTGATIIANVDDWLPAVAKMGKSGAHQFGGHFSGKRERNFVEMLQLCDGAVTSTAWLQHKLSSAMPHKPVRVARNGLDMDRYDQWRGKGTQSEGITLGWAGGTGHGDALARMLPDVWETMRRFPDVNFLTVGDRFPIMAQPVVPDAIDPIKMVPEFPDRVKGLEWADMMFYPLNIDQIDIVLAPAMDNDFYRGKSQLRYYEAAAMGKPIIAADMYDEVDDGRTGYRVPEGESWRPYMANLIANPELREQMGVNALDYVTRNATIHARRAEWTMALGIPA